MRFHTPNPLYPHACVGISQLKKAKAAAAAASSSLPSSVSDTAASATAPGLDPNDINPANLTCWLVVSEPKFLPYFVKHWTDEKNIPDAVDHPPSLVAQWENAKTKSGRLKYKLAAHKLFPGCARQWLNNAVDFAVSQGYVPVIYPQGEDIVNLCTKFICVVWCCYVGYMDARPSIESDRAQHVFQYMLANESVMVQLWRARIYYYSSGTIFKKVMGPMKTWLAKKRQRRERILRRLRDKDGLYATLSTCMWFFMMEKTQPFPHATKSQMDFWNVPAWKRAMVYVFALRHILDEHCNKQWKKFTHEDYVFFVTAFDKFKRKDQAIWAQCAELLAVSATSGDSEAIVKRKAKAALRLTRFAPSPEKKRKVITHVEVNLVSSESEGDSDAGPAE